MCFTVKLGECADLELLIFGMFKNTKDSRFCNIVGGTGSVTEAFLQ